MLEGEFFLLHARRCARNIYNWKLQEWEENLA